MQISPKGLFNALAIGHHSALDPIFQKNFSGPLIDWLPMSRTYLKDLERGMTVNDVFLVESANLKQARNGSHFIQLMLRDFTGSVKAMRWESNKKEFRDIERNPFLLTRGRVEEYQGKPQIIIDELSTLSADDAQVNPAEFLPRTDHCIDSMRAELENLIASIPNPDVLRIIEKIFARPGVWEKFCQAPAGKTMHHAYIGGLLEHVLSLAKMADRVLENYSWLDRSIMMAGVVLHDLGKIAELGYATGFSYTDEGQLIGHIVIISEWIEQAAKEFDDIDANIVLQLKHIVLSHHGQLEYGSPKVPMTAEAIALHFIDNLDAKLAGYMNAFFDVAPEAEGNRWSDYNMMMGTRLYFPTQLDQSLGQRTLDPTPGAQTAGAQTAGAKKTSTTAPQATRPAAAKPEAESNPTGDLPF